MTCISSPFLTWNICISRVPLSNPSLASKCSNFLSSEEHSQKLKEAGKDGDKQLIIVSNTILVRLIASQRNYFWIFSAVFFWTCLKFVTYAYYYYHGKWFVRVEPVLDCHSMLMEKWWQTDLTFKADSC